MLKFYCNHSYYFEEEKFFRSCTNSQCGITQLPNVLKGGKWSNSHTLMLGEIVDALSEAQNKKDLLAIKAKYTAEMVLYAWQNYFSPSFIAHLKEVAKNEG